jgi:hypothetical protein
MRYSNGAGAGSGFAERGRAFSTHTAWQARKPSKGNGEESKELDRLCLTAHVTRCSGGAVCYSFAFLLRPLFFLFYVLSHSSYQHGGFLNSLYGFFLLQFCIVLVVAGGWSSYLSGAVWLFSSTSACAGVAGRLQSNMLGGALLFQAKSPRGKRDGRTGDVEIAVV